MKTPAEKSRTAAREEVIFSSAYGFLPRFFWYAVIPFLLLASTVLFIRAVWYGDGVFLGSIKVSPNIVAYAICPVFWLLCGLLVACDIYRYLNPQFVVVTNRGVTLPKGRFTNKTVSIAWNDLQALLEGRNFKGWQVCEIICTDLRTDVSVRITSMLFRDFDDFATFMSIMAEHMGQDWRFPGFLPGTFRGRKTPRR